MPIYTYKHTGPACEAGVRFDVEQSIRDEKLQTCPRCGGEVTRLISRVFVATPTTNSELKNMGFTKLVKRDDGVYENVTRTDKESRYFEPGKAETMPDLKSRISD